MQELVQRQEQKKGVLLALSAFIMWGIAPVYFKQLIHIDALEILAQRIIWAVVFLIVITSTLQNDRSFKAAKTTGYTLDQCLFTGFQLGLIYLVGK